MTTLCESGTQVSDLLRRVDVALYSAKRQGRNTTVVATDTMAMREALWVEDRSRPGSHPA